MDAKDFKCDTAGRLARQPEGYWAFVPAPPPTAFDASPGLVRLLSEADAALSELSGLGRYLPHPDLLTERTGQARGRVRAAHPILRALRDGDGGTT